MVTRETYFRWLCLVVMSCFMPLAFSAQAFPVEPPATSDNSKGALRRHPTLGEKELKEKAEAYGAKPPTPSEDAAKPPTPSEEAEKPQKPPAGVAGCECRPPRELWCKKELTGFEPGAFTHIQLESFAHSVTTDLLKLKDQSKERTILRFIRLVGQTDGLENPGICCWWKLVKVENECTSIMPEASPDLPLDERLLGLARACVTRKALEREFRDQLLAPSKEKDWPIYSEDIETGRLIGGQYRKVTVEIWVKDGC